MEDRILQISSEEGGTECLKDIIIEGNRSKISNIVLDIVEGNGDSKKRFHNFFKGHFLRLVSQENIKEIFPGYTKKNGKISKKFNSKFETYYRRYEKGIIGGILDNVAKKNVNGKINSKDFNNIVKKTIKDVFFAIFSFGDNLDPDIFDTVFRNTENDFEEIYNNQLEIFESFSQISYGKNVDQVVEKKENGEPQVLKMYKHLSAMGVYYDGKFCIETLKGSIETHCNNIMGIVYDIFDHWYKSTTLDNDTLENLQRFLLRMLQDISILEEKGRIDSESEIYTFFLDSNKSRYLDEMISKKEGTEFENEKFKTFIENSLNGKGDQFDNLCENIRIGRRKYLNSYSREYKSDEEANKTKLETVNFDDWYHIRSSKRREIFFNQLIVDGEGTGEITPRFQHFIPTVHSGENTIQYKRLHYGFLDFHFDEQKSALRGEEDGDKREKYTTDTINQFDRIKNKFSDMKIDDIETQKTEFIRNNKNDVDLLVGFWWYNLQQEHISANEVYQGEEGKKKFDRKYVAHGMIESVISDLKNEGLIGEETDHNIQFFKGVGLKNSSAWNKQRMFERLDHAYTHQLIDVKDMYLVSDGIEKHFKDMMPLYLPSINSNNKEDIEEYINFGLDTCTGLLEGNKNKCRLGYVYNLIELGFDITDLTQINELKEFLKYIKSTTPSVEKMMQDGHDDRKFLYDLTRQEGFSKFGSDGDDWKIGPSKKMGRVFQKSIGKYGGDLREMGDLTRMLFVCNDVKDMREKIKDFVKFLAPFSEENNSFNKHLIEQISIEDYVGNLTEKSLKPSGYRDMNLSIKLTNGNTVEVQFHFEDFLQFKNTGYKLGEEILDDNQMKEMKIQKFTQEESKQIQFLSEQDQNIELPQNFGRLCKGGEFIFSEEMNMSKENLLSSDVLYNLARSVEDESPLQKKIQRIESIGYDLAGGKTLVKELQ